MSHTLNGSTSTNHLLSAAKNGNANAQDYLFARVRPYLRRVAERMLFNGSIRGTDASDVAQRAVAAAMEHFPSFRGTSDSEWYAWLLAIIRNDINRLLRDARREARLADAIPLTEVQDATPSQHLRKREETIRLFAAMEQLPERDRQVIQLRNIDGLAYAEVASQLGCSEQSARQRWVRAVRRLSRELKDPT